MDESEVLLAEQARKEEEEEGGGEDALAPDTQERGKGQGQETKNDSLESDPLANFDEAFASADEDEECKDEDDHSSSNNDDESEEELFFLKSCQREDTSDTAHTLLTTISPEDILDQVDKHGNTGAHLAAARGDIQLYQAIASHCPQALDTENLDGKSPLSIAAAHGCLAIVLWTHTFQREIVAQELNDRSYFACTSCGLCLNGRERFASRICKKNRDHKWDGQNPPRHILNVRAADFNAAADRFLKDFHKNGPRPQGWWCKDDKYNSEASLS